MKKKTTYKAFQEKIVVCKSQEDGSLIFPFYEAQKHGNLFPKFFDTYPEAIMQLCDHVKEIALGFHLNLDAYKDGHQQIVFPAEYAFAKVDVEKDGHTIIYFEPGEGQYEDEILFDGHIIELIKEQK